MNIALAKKTTRIISPFKQGYCIKDEFFSFSTRLSLRLGSFHAHFPCFLVALSYRR